MTKELPMTYIASPYSHSDREVRASRTRLVSVFAGQLYRDGWPAFCPIAHSHAIHEVCNLPFVWEWWRPVDEWFIRRVNLLVVYCLEGWQDSIGVREEVEIAKQFGVPVMHVRPLCAVDYDALVRKLMEIYG